MKLGYVRVSAVEQNEERQLESMKKHGVEEENIFKEKVSAKDMNRPELQALLKHCRKGDTVYVHDFSRLAWSTKDLLNIVEQLEEKGVGLVSIKESLDTTTANGKLQLAMLVAINEFERANLLERQREGIVIAKEKGKYKGRKKIDFPENWDEVYGQWKSKEITATEAMRQMGLKKNTFYKLKKEYEEKEEYDSYNFCSPFS